MNLSAATDSSSNGSEMPIRINSADIAGSRSSSALKASPVYLNAGDTQPSTRLQYRTRTPSSSNGNSNRPSTSVTPISVYGGMEKSILDIANELEYIAAELRQIDREFTYAREAIDISESAPSASNTAIPLKYTTSPDANTHNQHHNADAGAEVSYSSMPRRPKNNRVVYPLRANHLELTHEYTNNHLRDGNYSADTYEQYEYSPPKQVFASLEDHADKASNNMIPSKFVVPMKTRSRPRIQQYQAIPLTQTKDISGSSDSSDRTQ